MPIWVKPNTHEMGSTSVEALGFDITAELVGMETVVSAAAMLVNRDTGATYDEGLIGTPNINNTDKIITQVVGNLRAGNTYRLVITAVIQSNVKEIPLALLIECPF